MRKLKRFFRAAALFQNFIEFIKLYYGQTSQTHVTLLTRSGLQIRARNNRWDARILTETFLDLAYLKMFAPLPVKPVIVDIGGYIGDFSLYVAHYLDAKVIAYEPTPENFDLLKKNVAMNALDGKVTFYNKGVGADDGNLTLNITRGDGAVHVSGFLYGDAIEQITVPSVSIKTIFSENSLEHIDLLKIDCEGGEFDILCSLTDALTDRIDRIVFEYHAIPGYLEKLATVRMRLATAGYRITEDQSNSLIAATKV
jgi:FkbM family methyltransferase